MPNFVPYAVLGSLSIIALITVAILKRNAAVFVISLAYAGMIYIFEYVIFLLLDCYDYVPNVWPGRYEDNVLGGITSNLLAVPTVAMIIAVYRLRFRTICGCILLFTVIELTFIRLGVFHLHWWKTEYTMAALLCFFLFGRKWLVYLKQGHRWCLYVSLLMFAWSVTGTIVFSLQVTGVRMFHSGLFADVHHDDIFVSALFALLKAMIIVVFVMGTEKFLWRFVSLLLILGANVLLIYMGVLKVFIPYWVYFLIYVPCCLIVLCIIVYAKKSLQSVMHRGSL